MNSSVLFIGMTVYHAKKPHLGKGKIVEVQVGNYTRLSKHFVVEWEHEQTVTTETADVLRKSPQGSKEARNKWKRFKPT